MISPQNHEFSIAEILSGSVSKWYSDVDNCLSISEVVPGQYEYTSATSYGNVGQTTEGASTYVDIQAERFKLISIDNSFITLEQSVEIELDKAQNALVNTPNAGIYYVGQLYSPAILEQYRIYSNSDLIQTVNHAEYEWFLQYQSTPDDVKENNENFATVKKIREMNPMVPGTYVDLSKIDAANKTITVKYNVKIPLNSFLLIKNLKWLPSFMGKISIELFPTFKNIVVMPVLAPELPPAIVTACHADHAVNLGFTQLNMKTKNLVTYTEQGYNTGTPCTVIPATCTIAEQTWAYKNQTSDKVMIRCAMYMLKIDVFNQLVEQYLQVPLLFPIQTVQGKDFQNIIGNNEHFDTAMTVHLQHCDSAYTVFRKKGELPTMCFTNPGIQYQFNIDGKYYPREPYNSVSDIRSLNYTLDALNVNNSNITSIGEDLRTSLQPYTWVNESDKNGTTFTQKKRNTTGAKSNFMIGIPFTDSEDFGGGISTNGTVQIQLVGDRLSEAHGATDKAGNRIEFGQPLTIFTEDAILKIRSTKPPGQPQWNISHASVEQVIGGVSM